MSDKIGNEKTLLITLNIKDLENFLSKIEELGYAIERGTHTMLLDNSEIEEIKLLKDNKVKAIVIAHYITHYYKAIVDANEKKDEELLKSLLEAKYSGEKWYAPVSPVAIITNDDDIVNFLEKYSDDYPYHYIREYVEIYRKKNPNSYKMFSGLLASVLEKLFIGE